MIRSLPILGPLAAIGVWLWTTAAVFAQAATGPLGPGQAELEIDAPAGTQLTVAGTQRGSQKLFRFTSTPGQWHDFEVTARFPKGASVTDRVILKAGWHVTLPMFPAPATRPEMVLQIGHPDFVLAVALSADGKYLATGSGDTTAVLWDTATGQQLRAYTGHTGPVRSVAFSPDGKYLATASEDKTAALWDVVTGRKARTFAGHREAVLRLAYSPGGEYVLTGSMDKTAILWDAATGQQVRTLAGHTDFVNGLAFSRDGKRLATSSGDRSAVVWDVASGQKVVTLRGHSDSVASVAFSPDGSRLLTGSADRLGLVWDVASGRRLLTLQGHTNLIHAVAYSPDGKYLATGSYDRTAMIWDAATGRRVRLLEGHANLIWGVAFSPEGKRLATASSDYTAALWDVASGQKLRTFRGYAGNVRSLAASADGKHLAAGFTDGTAVLWDAVAGLKLRTLQGHSNWVNFVAFSPDGRYLATASYDKTAGLWDIATGKKVKAFTGHSDAVFTVAFSFDGKYLATGSYDGTAALWEVTTGQKLRTFKGHASNVYAVAFSRDGRYLATGSQDRLASLWDVATGRKVRDFKEYLSAAYSLMFSPDDRHLAVGYYDRLIVIWDVATGQKQRTLEGHTDTLWSIAYSPDGRHLASASWDRTAMLWDVATGQRLRTFLGHTERVWATAFGADGRHVLTGSIDGGIRIWDVATGHELARLISMEQARDWLVVTPEGLFDGSANGREKVSFRVGGGLSVAPVDRFFQDFHSAGLLAAIWRGDRPLPAVELGKQPAPTVRIVAPVKGGPIDRAEVTLDIEVRDEGGGVSGPWVMHNGARVLSSSQPRRDGKVLRRGFALALVEGENRFEVKAASADGSWESEPALLSLRYERALERPELHVVTVGINRYASSSMNLRYAAADARVLGELFARRGKALYQGVHLHSLIDEQATRARIRETLAKLARATRAQDTVLLFLAGHGTMVGQRYYFIPQEFRRGDGSLEDDIRKQGLPGDELAEYLTAAAALRRVLIFDTCQSGGAVGLTKSARNPFALRGAVERLTRSQGVFTIAAAASGEEAQEVAELGHGVLTYALLAGLRAIDKGPLANRSIQPDSSDRVVNVLEWFTYASGQVPRLTSQYFGREQDVQTSGQGSSFPLLPIEER